MPSSIDEELRTTRWVFHPGPLPPGAISRDQAIARFRDPPAGAELTAESGRFSDKRVRLLPSGEEERLYLDHPAWMVGATDPDGNLRRLVVDAMTGTRIMELIPPWHDPRRRWDLIAPLEPPLMTAQEAIELMRDEGWLGIDEGLPITAEYGGWLRSGINGAEVLDAWRILVDTSRQEREIGTEGPNRIMPLEAAGVTMVDDKARRHMVTSTIPQEGPDGSWLYPQRG